MPPDLHQSVLSLIPPEETLLANLQGQVGSLILAQQGSAQLGVQVSCDQGLLRCSSLSKKLLKLSMISEMCRTEAILC